MHAAAMTVPPTNKVAIVTGASSGIGLALSTSLIAQSWTVVLADINATAGAAAASTLGPKASFVETDVSSWTSQLALFKSVFTRFGRLDFVAANAGIDDKDAVYADFEAEEPEALNFKTLEVDLLAPIMSFRLALFYMRRNPDKSGGAIVITSSSAGLYPFSSNPEYAAAKHGLIGFARSVAPVLKREKITVNCICPALVSTNLAPASLWTLIPKDQLTPMSTIMRAFHGFIDGHKDLLTGQAAECAIDDIFYRDPVDFPSQSQKDMFSRDLGAWMSAYDM
ncbi:uncharacterized protein V1518DRAFT_414253 [Limtongia smithiae]|uniref:uncharacterized protein n=1 Tax=Limtongia smithiae TaxID=1125753 RepID=UPI0034CD95A6